MHGYYFRGKVFCKCKQGARTRIVNLLPTEKNLCQNFALVVRRVKVCKKRKGVHDVGRAWNPVGGDSGAGPLWRTEARFEGGSAFQMKPAQEHFNQKRELELLGCWRTADTKGRALTAFDFQCILSSAELQQWCFALLLLEIQYSEINTASKDQQRFLSWFHLCRSQLRNQGYRYTSKGVKHS